MLKLYPRYGLDPDPELYKFKAESGINHCGSAILLWTVFNMAIRQVSKDIFQVEDEMAKSWLGISQFRNCIVLDPHWTHTQGSTVQFYSLNYTF